MLPEGALAPPLRGRLKALLEGEIAGVQDDWQTRRPWFVRTNNPVTNQWVLPTEGLVRASLVLGVGQYRDAYDLGVKNLLAALDAHGPKGEFEEGFGYASFTVTSLLNAAHAMAVAGDRRALIILSRKISPHGRSIISNPAIWSSIVLTRRLRRGGTDASATVPLAVCTGSPAARWALNSCAGGPSTTVRVAASTLHPANPAAAPPLFAYYERATWVNWRSSWEDTASGVWVRGGHELDQHDHQDRGHVNFIAHGRPVLIEAGTPAYHHPRMMTDYTPGVGHNVLQLGMAGVNGTARAGELVCLPGWQKVGGIAPISVEKLDASGGTVLVDGTACYDNLERWIRTVRWDASSMNITDEVVLEDGRTEIILFRWHLGTEEKVSISGEGKHHTITFPGTSLDIAGDVPLTVAQTAMPDHTLAGHVSEDDPKNMHVCLIVQSAAPVGSMKLVSYFRSE